MTTFIFWVCPLLSPGIPLRHVIKKQILPRTVSTHSLESSTSTLVDEPKTTQDTTVDSNPDGRSKCGQLCHCILSLTISAGTPKFQKLGHAFVKFSTPIMAPTHSIKPFARRLSLPARRFSESFATAVATPFRTHSLDVEPSSYFTSVLVSEAFPHHVENPVGRDVRAIETEDAIEEIAFVVDVEEPHPEKKVIKMKRVKRVTRKIKSLLHFRQRSTHLLGL